MKKLYLMIFLVFNSLIYAANVYFDYPTNGSTYYSLGGSAGVNYHIHTVSFFFVVDWYGAKVQYPDGHWSDWQDGQSGGWVFRQAGVYHIQGAVHVVYDLGGQQDYFMYSNTLVFYMIDNDPPSIPRNFVVSVYHTQYNSYPKLTWTLNDEADVRYASDGYYIERKKTPPQNSQFIPIAIVSGLTNQFIDYEINYAGSGPNLVEYRIRAKDINNNYSDYTDIQSVHWGNAWKKGNHNEDLTEYKLWQNYPNPFNPTTKISYQIKEKGNVKLLVYDILGNVVDDLVDKFQESGQYSIDFNATGLPSGVYIYSLRVNGLVINKRMILLK